jgi:DNA-directed RNA polymerase II subunit RPB1
MRTHQHDESNGIHYIYNEEEEEDVISEIDHVEFTMFSAEDMVNSSVLHVSSGLTVEGHKIVPGGLLDRKLGTLEKNVSCETCENGIIKDTGHFGHHNFPVAIYNINFIPAVVNILKCICFNCSRLLIDKNSKAYKRILKKTHNKTRFEALKDHIKPHRKCWFPLPIPKKVIDDEGKEIIETHVGCGMVQPNITSTKTTIQICEKIEEIDAEGNVIQKEKKYELSATDVYRKLRMIQEEDYYILACHPQKNAPTSLIFGNTFPIEPVTGRPSNLSDPLMRTEDVFTTKLGDIVSASLDLRKKIEDKNDKCEEITEEDIKEEVSDLTYAVSVYLDGEIAKTTVTANNRANKATKGKSQLLSKKKGIIRSNIQGKRVNHNARFVVVPGADIPIHHIGIPKKACLTLCWPERVTDQNIERLKAIVQLGHKHIDGANYVKPKGSFKTVFFKNSDDPLYAAKQAAERLKVGDVVHRHLRNGDIVLTNRQPSLHQGSIMAHFVFLVDGVCIKLPESDCTSYNADFDGDEINIFLPQSEEPLAEARMLLGVSKNVITGASSQPNISFIQNHLLAFHVISKKDVFYKREEVCQFMMQTVDHCNIPPPCILKPVELWSGKQVVSLILPNMTWEKILKAHQRIEGVPDEMTPYETKVLIKDGQLICGMLNKSCVGSASQSLVHSIALHFGEDAAVEFINRGRKLGNHFLKKHCVSVGLNDMNIKEGTKERLQSLANKCNYELDKVACRDDLDHDEKERVSMCIINKMVNEATYNLEDEISKDNAFKIMLEAGSKGSTVNYILMMRILGQQNIEGNRIQKSFHGRTLPHFSHEDTTAESRGFVFDNFCVGIDPRSMFFHSQSNRINLIASSLSVRDIGYFQRRIIKSMEDLSVRYDASVTNSSGDIIQFVFGEDGIDPYYCVRQNVIWLLGTPQEWSPEELSYQLVSPRTKKLLKMEYEKMKKDHDWAVKQKSLERSMPVWFEFLFNNLPAQTYTGEEYEEEAVTIDEVIDGVMNITKEIRKANPIFKRFDVDQTVWMRSIRYHLSSKSIVLKRKMIRRQWFAVTKTIVHKILRAAIDPSTMVGAYSSKAIGHPASQQTLNAFQPTVGNDKLVSYSLKRLKEIATVSRKLSKPLSVIYLKPQIANNKEAVDKLIARLTCTMFRDVILGEEEVFFDGDTRFDDFDGPVLEQYRMFPWFDLDTDKYILSSWVLRLEVNIKVIKHRNLRIEDVVNLFYSRGLQRVFQIIYFANEERGFIRIKPFYDKAKDVPAGHDILFLKEWYTTVLSKWPISGVPKLNSMEADQLPSGEWRIIAQGINLKQLFLWPEIDKRRTTCNDPHEMHRMFGIESARWTLLNEYESILLSGDVYIDRKWLLLLCDLMSRGPQIMSTDRFGFESRKQSLPLHQASFEEAAHVLEDAARYGETDYLLGVSESLYVGKPFQGGTGAFDVLTQNGKKKTLAQQKQERTRKSEKQKKARLRVKFTQLFSEDDIPLLLEPDEEEEDEEMEEFRPSSPPMEDQDTMTDEIWRPTSPLGYE